MPMPKPSPTLEFGIKNAANFKFKSARSVKLKTPSSNHFCFTLLLPDAKDDTKGKAHVTYNRTIDAHAEVFPLRPQNDFAALA